MFASSMPSDDATLLATLRGESHRRQAETTLYQRHAGLVRWGVRRYDLDDEDASMAYSDAVLTVLEHVRNGRFEERCRLKTYLHAVFDRKCLDTLRRRQARADHGAVSLDDLPDSVPDPARSVLQALIVRQDAQRLRALLDCLEPRARALLLGWGAGHSDDELARQFGYRSAQVAKVSRHRLLGKLRALYGGPISGPAYPPVDAPAPFSDSPF